MEPTPKDRTENEMADYMLLTLAEGNIEAGPEQQERLDEFTRRVGSGEFHVHTDGKIPCGCIDGRDSRDGLTPKPDSAGGTESIFVADDLTTKRFAADDGSTLGAYKNTLKFVSDEGYEVGGHDDEHAEGEASGCGANDKLPYIYDMIVRKGDELREIAASLGITVDDDTFAEIIENAQLRSHFSAGRELLDALKEYGDDKVDPIVGKHREVVAVINMREGTTLDRTALKAEFGEDYQAFNVDAWTFEHSAELTSLTPEEKQAKIFALALYNLATAHVLCGKNMRVTVLQ